LLALVLRSAVAPLYLILSVGLSYLAALGLSTLLFIDIGGSGGITFVLPFLMFIFLLALGEDYNILVMTRIREEARSRELSQAVVRAIGRTGPTVTAAGMVLAGTFGVLAFEAGNGPGSGQIRDVGFGLATAPRSWPAPGTDPQVGAGPSLLDIDGRGAPGPACTAVPRL
jgi:RND superfamily putative drug exporter